MKLCWFRRLLPGLIVLTLVGSANAQPLSPFIPGPWWRDFQKSLGLSDDQSNRIEAVFQAALPELRHKRDELTVQEAELSRLLHADADEAAIAKQSDRVEAVRTVLNKNRTLMLVRMRAIMTPDQRGKLNVLREQWEKDHPALPRRPGPSNTPH
jgi:Spy/CpxP family protein refolding chaperone